MKKFILALVTLASVTGVFSCNEDDSEDAAVVNNNDTTTVKSIFPEGYEIWNPTKGTARFLIHVYSSKDSAAVVTNDATYTKICGELWKWNVYLECRGGKIYQGVLGGDSGNLYPEDMLIPENFHGVFDLVGMTDQALGQSTLTVTFEMLASVGSDETLIWHWADKSTDTVHVKIIECPNPAADANPLIGYFLNGKPAKNPMRIYK